MGGLRYVRAGLSRTINCHLSSFPSLLPHVYHVPIPNNLVLCRHAGGHLFVTHTEQCETGIGENTGLLYCYLYFLMTSKRIGSTGSFIWESPFITAVLVFFMMFSRNNVVTYDNYILYIVSSERT
jgi:hypothetical protein